MDRRVVGTADDKGDPLGGKKRGGEGESEEECFHEDSNERSEVEIARRGMIHGEVTLQDSPKALAIVKPFSRGIK